MAWISDLGNGIGQALKGGAQWVVEGVTGKEVVEKPFIETVEEIKQNTATTVNSIGGGGIGEIAKLVIFLLIVWLIKSIFSK